MPPPLDPDKRAAIAQAIRDGGTCNAIARDHSVAPSTVSLIAKQEQIEDAFDRASIKDAHEARVTDLTARRSELAERLMDRAFWVEERIGRLQAVPVVTKEGVEIVHVEATARDVRDFLVGIGIAVDKVGVLTRDDSQGLAAVDSWLRSLGVGATA